ncbi:AfsR/SARP family transcriptional regulator [Amycolatopsis sp. CA-230715]|uniref:AfsR/SARP family transcriptional regulator n=1 Tax=Amycolatopsis sp. CA-230715 TaxID=2745196 RepID=UPI001C02B024|nr:BTAD domain-containing putative transcriptional regulator [Amycolatopsis sp. CA-230715]QWF84129.1 Regulatory protein AfsR [Amycolatopsis sp. CA-230715]
MSAELSFKMLGPLELGTGGEWVSIRSPRQRTVLAMLLLSPDQVVSVDSLIEAVWSDHPPATGRTQIAICVTALRKIFRAAHHSEEVIATVAPGYRLNDKALRIDAVDFGTFVDEARASARRGEAAAAVEKYTRALDLWRGQALSGVSGYSVEVEAERLEQERLTVFEQRTELKLALGQHRAVVGELAALVREHPQRETARAQLMLAQYRCGQRVEALETFHEGRKHAIETYGLDPGVALRELHEAILQDDASLAAPSTSDTVRPVRAIVPAQLPSDIPAFTGREVELARLDAMVVEHADHEPTPVGLVTGGPGVGKTAVAVHWARRMAGKFPGGQLFVDLHGHDGQEAADPDTVLAHFLRALGVSEAAIPAASIERAALYRSVIDGRRVLVVLDNARDYRQIAPLMPGSGSCCVLVTSGEPIPELLGHYCPVSVRMTPLPAEAARELIGKVVGDRRVVEDPAGTGRLAELCDRLPLALRVSAARLTAKPHWRVSDLVSRMMDPARRFDELGQAGPDLRSRFRLSYGRLDPLAARLFRLLGWVSVPCVDTAGAADLLSVGRVEAELALERLVDAYLAEVVLGARTGPTQYRVGGLARVFAQEQDCDESVTFAETACQP